MTKVMNEKEAAAYIGMSVSFLQKDRTEGRLIGRTPGPRWLKIGKRVLYLKDDLDLWLEILCVNRQQQEADSLDV